MFLLVVAKGHDHRGDHAQAEIELAWRTGEGTLFFKDDLFNRVPARAAEFFRPGGGAPAFFIQNFLPALGHVFIVAQAFLNALADVVREVVFQELANFGAEGLLFRGVIQVHVLPLCLLAEVDGSFGVWSCLVVLNARAC